MKNSILPPIHPGEILREEYLVPMEMSAGALAKEIDVPRTRIERLVNEQTSLSTDTALRLAKYFDTSPEFWMNLQASYDLKITAKALEDELEMIEAYIEPVRQYA
ncbi:MAG: HigA family addiction module antidote protein [Mesorhizobium sp.]|nr:HigA family addiction module antidote protein [Mesorhizobium sp.]